MADAVPTIDGFLAFVHAQGVPAAAIANDADPNLNTAYQLAVAFVNLALQAASPVVYTWAVYNLGMATLVEVASDTPPSTFFQTLRQKFDIYGNLLGILTTTSDEGTSVSVEVPDFVKTMSVSDLQYARTPWGRNYIAIAQRVASNWGLS